METKNQQPVYFFDSQSGATYLHETELPAKRNHLYLVMNRGKLNFGSFSMNSKKRVKDSDILNIQGHFIPYKNSFTNLIYNTEAKEEKRIFFWIGDAPGMGDVESLFYDEIPESLIFKGKPESVGHFRIFVFQRVVGYEIIYFDGDDFYSLFTEDPALIPAKVVMLARKFSLPLNHDLKVLSEIEFSLSAVTEASEMGDEAEGSELAGVAGGSEKEIDIRRVADDAPCFFLPDYFPVKKRYSNISRNKQVKSIKNIIRLWNRNLNIILVLLLAVLVVNIAAHIYLKKDNGFFSKQFDTVNMKMEMSEDIRFRLNNTREKLASYPDHMQYLKTVSEAMGPEAVLIAYSLREGKITMEGYCADSLALLSQLRKSSNFKDVKFKTAVTKNAHSKRERFEIEIILSDVSPTGQDTDEKKPAVKVTSTAKEKSQAVPAKIGKEPVPAKKENLAKSVPVKKKVVPSKKKHSGKYPPGKKKPLPVTPKGKKKTALMKDSARHIASDTDPANQRLLEIQRPFLETIFGIPLPCVAGNPSRVAGVAGRRYNG
ncbi:MAG: hypothetical protein GY765_22125 [bacterium]|nr:hypothetical protein [bacterium]